MMDLINAFEAKLYVFRNDIITKKLQVLPKLEKNIKDLAAQKKRNEEKVIDDFISIMDSLIKEFSARFSQFKELSETFKFIMYPDVISFDKLNLSQFDWLEIEELEMQLIHFQSSSIWNQKFIETRKKLELIEALRLTSNISKNTSNEILETWNSIPDAFNCLKKLAYTILTIFSSTYAYPLTYRFSEGEEWYKPRDLGKQCDIFYASKGKSYDEPERAKWNDSEKRSFNGSWDKQPFGEKKSENFSSRKNFDKVQVTEIKKFACFTCGSDKHFKRDCPKNKEVDNKRLNVNKVSTEGTELVDGTVAARVDLLGKVIPRGAIEDKLSKLVKTSISVDGKLVHALLDSGTEITVIKKDLVPRISVEGASTIYLKGIFGPAVKCHLVYVPIGLATGGQVNVVHQQVLCALAEVLVEDVLLPPEVLNMLGGAQSEENSLDQSSRT
ncbi:CCHC-type domain-containing protein [Trichonephila clavipes]|nr:CCHC-type domain-containing protein [Trichonephila clavipes]